MCFTNVDSMLGRRRFLTASLTVATSGLVVGLYTWQVEPHWLELVGRSLPIQGLPAALVGKRLVQLSDLHVGPSVADDYVLETFRRVVALRPDIVVYTGDFTSYHAEIFTHAERIYAHLPKGRIATVGILGNHDYGPRWAEAEVANRLAAILRATGMQVLRNEVADVAGLQIVGMDDLWAGQFLPAQALAQIDSSRAILVLSHNPDTVDLPGWDRFQGWILAGHTHGGQCKPPFLPPPLLPVKNRRYTAGEFALTADRRLYINRGVGHLLQVRFNVRPEVTVFELQNA
jgi:predicted MPP superfamily phosphohydrolase